MTVPFSYQLLVTFLAEISVPRVALLELDVRPDVLGPTPWAGFLRHVALVGLEYGITFPAPILVGIAAATALVGLVSAALV